MSDGEMLMYRERLGNVGPEGITEYVQLTGMYMEEADLVPSIRVQSTFISYLNMSYPFPVL